jgi:rod shape-determining protein MreC
MYDKTVRRRRAVLALLVVSSLILLTAYFGESAAGGLHNVQRGILQVVSPIQEGASRALKPFRDLFGWVGDTVSAKSDLSKVRKDRDSWKQRAIANEAAQRDNAHFRALLGLDRAPKDLTPFGPVTSRVVGQSPTLWYVQIYIDKGTSAGIREDMPVIATDGRDIGTGLIGKVQVASRNSSVVRLITDSSVAVPARTLRGSAVGVVSPKVGNPRDLILNYTRKNDRIEPRDVVVTAGTTSRRSDLESIYPPDLPIGTVTRVDDPSSDAQEVHLKPFVDLQRISFVQVLTKKVDGNRP